MARTAAMALFRSASGSPIVDALHDFVAELPSFLELVLANLNATHKQPFMDVAIDLYRR
jgi:hypothetical protein